MYTLDEMRPMLTGTPRRRPPGSRAPRVAVIGAGAGGLCMGVRLRQAGIESFTIYEKGDGVGGTWRDNTYPGAECDARSHLYSFSFAKSPYWTRRYAGQEEILAYFERIADDHGLRPHLHLGAEVTRLTWDDDEQVWHVHTADGGDDVAEVVVSALGQLNRPYLPQIPGRDDFAGTMFHSARWDHDHDLSGERVAVIGNAASALQFIPSVAEQAGSLDVYQRTANWVFPKPNEPYSEATKARFERHPALLNGYRRYQYLVHESRFGLLRNGSALGKLAVWGGRSYLERAVPEPELRAMLEPDYPVGCKRLLISSDYYPALRRDDVTLVTDPIERITATGIVTADGTARDVDTIILGTGFDSTHFLAPMHVTGQGGRVLADAWQDGAEAYLGLCVAGFPNLFMLYGPNTNLGHNSILIMIEAQVHYILSCLDELDARGAAALDVSPDAMAAFNAEVQAAMTGLVWESSCHSWYKNEAGKVTNNWPWSTIQYWLRTRRPRFDEFSFAARREPARLGEATPSNGRSAAAPQAVAAPG
jgi:cation diffusion facilitator CzcD-associated flavoprotein CzcO